MRTAIVATFALSLAASTALAQTSSGTSSSGGAQDSGSTTATTTASQSNRQSGLTGPIRPTPPNSQTSSGSSQTPATRTGKNALNETVTDCMELWEPATHMSKADWQRTCRRVQGRIDQVTKQVLGK